MNGKTDYRKMFDACMEGSACREMMQEMLGSKGAESPCAAMMEKMMAGNGERSTFPCADMMKQMMGAWSGKTETPKTQGGEGHVRDE